MVVLMQSEVLRWLGPANAREHTGPVLIPSPETVDSRYEEVCHGVGELCHGRPARAQASVDLSRRF
jgi:hypothetical protein